MAERIQVELVDDIDGSNAQHTITFGLDGATYEIDLNESHTKHLRSVFARYIARARTLDKASVRAARQREREERETRQVNRQLTEQIRGAAQRTREKLSKAMQDQTAEKPAEAHEAAATEGEITMTPPAVPEPEKRDKVQVPAVVLPQFSSAVD